MPTIAAAQTSIWSPPKACEEVSPSIPYRFGELNLWEYRVSSVTGNNHLRLRLVFGRGEPTETSKDVFVPADSLMTAARQIVAHMAKPCMLDSVNVGFGTVDSTGFRFIRFQPMAASELLKVKIPPRPRS